MEDLLQLKFGIRENYLNVNQDAMRMLKKLAATGNVELIFGNKYHDTYWGVCYCNEIESCKSRSGKNFLGNLVMDIRTDIHNKIEIYSPHKKLCDCGNHFTKRLLYTVKASPKLAFVCDNSDCMRTTLHRVQLEATDDYIVDYNPEALTNVSYIPPKETATVKPEVQDQLPDDEMAQYVGYSECGIWQGCGNRTSSSSTSSSVVERKYETLVIQC